MKKSLLGLLLAVALVAPALAEGWFVGGNLGFSSLNTKGDRDAQKFEIVPEVGYNVNEKWDVGLDIGYTYLKNFELPSSGVAIGDDVKGQAFGGQVFVRYKAFEIGNFSVLAKAGVGYKNTKYENWKYDATDEDDYTVNTYGVEIVPVVTYKINDSWSIIADINFLSFGYEHNSGVGSMPDSDKFGFDLNNGEIASIGFQYHF